MKSQTESEPVVDFGLTKEEQTKKLHELIDEAIRQKGKNLGENEFNFSMVVIHGYAIEYDLDEIRERIEKEVLCKKKECK